MEPTFNGDNVVSRLKLNSFVTSDDGVDEILLSRFNNCVIELKRGAAVSSFRLEQPFSIVQQLSVFYSYDPKFKHYLFMNDSDLFVMRKTNVLFCHKVYSNVVHYVIEDYFNIGRPQVVIYLTGQNEPVVTDCISVGTFSIGMPKQVQSLAPLIQKSKLRIKNAENLLSEKVKVLSKLSMMLAFNCDDDKILTTTDRIVYLREGLAAGDVGLLSKGVALSVGTPWFKIHRTQWVIGFPVVNVSKKELSSFEMYVSHCCITITKTLLFVRTSDGSEVDFFLGVETLHHEQYGVIVVVMNEPPLVESTFVMKWVCSFESVEPEQCYLGEVEVSINDFWTNKYKLFTPVLSAEDLITIQATSIKHELIFELLHGTFSSFLASLDAILNFRRVANVVFINTGISALPCSLLAVDEFCKKITFYVTTNNEFLLMIHRLSSDLKGTVLFKHPNSDPSKALEAMRNEVTYVKGFLIQELMENDSSRSHPVNLNEATRDLMLLEIDSAVQINLLKKYS